MTIAPISSRRGILTAANGATLTFEQTIRHKVSPLAYQCSMWAAAPNAYCSGVVVAISLLEVLLDDSVVLIPGFFWSVSSE